jgi:hypothetical protein
MTTIRTSQDTQARNAGNRRQCKVLYKALMAHAVMLNYLRTDSIHRSRKVTQSVNSAPFTRKGPKSPLLCSQDAKNFPCPTNETNSLKTFWDSTNHEFVTLIPTWKPKLSQPWAATSPLLGMQRRSGGGGLVRTQLIWCPYFTTMDSIQHLV